MFGPLIGAWSGEKDDVLNDCRLLAMNPVRSVLLVCDMYTIRGIKSDVHAMINDYNLEDKN